MWRLNTRMNDKICKSKSYTKIDDIKSAKNNTSKQAWGSTSTSMCG